MRADVLFNQRVILDQVLDGGQVGAEIGTGQSDFHLRQPLNHVVDAVVEFFLLPGLGQLDALAFTGLQQVLPHFTQILHVGLNPASTLVSSFWSEWLQLTWARGQCEACKKPVPPPVLRDCALSGSNYAGPDGYRRCTRPGSCWPTSWWHRNPNWTLAGAQDLPADPWAWTKRLWQVKYVQPARQPMETKPMKKRNSQWFFVSKGKKMKGRNRRERTGAFWTSANSFPKCCRFNANFLIRCQDCFNS